MADASAEAGGVADWGLDATTTQDWGTDAPAAAEGVPAPDAEKPAGEGRPRREREPEEDDIDEQPAPAQRLPNRSRTGQSCSHTCVRKVLWRTARDMCLRTSEMRALVLDSVRKLLSTSCAPRWRTRALAVSSLNSSPYG